MRRTRSRIDNCALVIESGVVSPGDIAIVERKGWGHPDTLADHLAERLSRAYSRYTLERFGAVLPSQLRQARPARRGLRGPVRFGPDDGAGAGARQRPRRP
jgi:hypothetical protein